MTATTFPDVPAWPDQLADGRDARHDNQPPLEERIMLEFVEDLEREGITARVAQLLESAGKVPAIDSDTIAGKVGDLCKMASDVGKRIDTAREKHNRPLLNAQRSLKAKADGVFAPLANAITTLRQSLNAYMAEQARKADEERRNVEEVARAAREAAEAERQRQIEAGAPDTPEPPAPVIETPKVEAPVARGDMGARVGTVTRWHHRVDSVRKLPDSVLTNPTVLEAIDKVLRARIRGGEREIKGCTIWSEQEASVR